MTPKLQKGPTPESEGWLEAIESLVNGVLTLDGLTLAALAELSGRIVAVESSQSRLRLIVSIRERGIKLSSGHDGPADVVIRGSIPDVLRFLFAGRPATAAGDFEISGDAALANGLQQIFAGMEPDWEEAVARHVGDTAARKLGVLFRSARDVAREARHALGMDLGEYLRFETRLVPDRDEVERFLVCVDALRDDVARLQFRVERLRRHDGT